jgi:hypothetical protein
MQLWNLGYVGEAIQAWHRDCNSRVRIANVEKEEQECE